MNMVRVSRSIIIAGILAASICRPLAFGAESAYEWQEKGSVAFEFRFRQADLVTQRGAHKVFRTLVYQATRACTPSGDSGASLHRTDRKCVAALVESVVRRVDSETLVREWQRTQQSTIETALAQVMD